MKKNLKNITSTDFKNKSSEKTDFDYIQYSEKDCVLLKENSLNKISTSKNKDFIHWIDIKGLKNKKDIVEFCQQNNIHRLTTQDILENSQRTKFQEFDEYSFLTLKSLQTTDNELQIEQISLILKDNFLISFQEKNNAAFQAIKQKLTANHNSIRNKEISYLFYVLIESLLDNYFKVLNSIEEKTDVIEFHMNEEPSSEDLSLLEKYKKQLYFIKKSILPLKEFTLKVERKELSFIGEDLYKYFFEVKDLCLTIIDECDILINAIESDINLFFSVQGQRMNEIMKTLTVMATIFIPLTFIAGVYGMNFTNIPELDFKFGYLAVWIIFIVTAISLLIYFRKKKWF